MQARGMNLYKKCFDWTKHELILIERRGKDSRRSAVGSLSFLGSSKTTEKG